MIEINTFAASYQSYLSGFQISINKQYICISDS